MCDAVQTALLISSEPKLTRLSFHHDFESFACELRENFENTVAFVPFSEVRRAVSVFPDLPLLAFGPPTYIHECFNAGVRDYLRTPWDAAEFWARISRHIDPCSYSFSWATIHATGTSTSINGTHLTLRPCTHQIFEFLVRARGKVVLRKYLLNAMSLGNPASRLIDVCIAELRQAIDKLGLAKSEPRILSHYRQGYSISI